MARNGKGVERRAAPRLVQSHADDYFFLLPWLERVVPPVLPVLPLRLETPR
jgi:hypothetical protein